MSHFDKKKNSVDSLEKCPACVFKQNWLSSYVFAW